MADETALEIVRQALVIVLMIATPLLMVGMILGLLISLFQSVTSIQDQTLTFVPKIIAIVIVAMLMMPWIVMTLMQFATEMFRLF